MATQICIASTKDGVAKTTPTANFGAMLADLGKRVLLVDADIQPTLSSYCRLLTLIRMLPIGLEEATLCLDKRTKRP